MTTDETNRPNDSATPSARLPSWSGERGASRRDRTDATVVNRRAVLQAVGAGTVGLPALTSAATAQEQDYEPEIVMKNSFENGMVLAKPDGELPPADVIDFSPEQGGPKGELGAEVAEAARGITETEVAVRKRPYFLGEAGGNEPEIAQSVVVTDRAPPEAAQAPGDRQLQRLKRQGVFKGLGNEIVVTLDSQLEELTGNTVFLSGRVPGKGWSRFPEQAQAEISDVVMERLETQFERTRQGFVAQPVSATTQPRGEAEGVHPPALGGWRTGRRADAVQDWCVRLCNYFCPWWLQGLCEYYCDEICDGLCWIIDWFANYFNIESWEESLLREYAGC